MSKKHGAHQRDAEQGQHTAAGGFVPATQQSQSKGKKSDSSAGKPVVNGTLAQYSRLNSHYQTGPSKMSKGKKAGIIALVIALVAAVVGLGFYAYKEMQKQQINADLQLPEEEALEVEKELTQKPKKDYETFEEPFTVLLLGSDARADDPDMGARTDTIILVRVDPTVNTVSMVSIPRDTRIEIEGVGIEKFNAAYTHGGPSGTIAAVKKLTGVDIDHYAEINFEGLVGLVDAIGGIDVVVDEVIDDVDAGGHIDAGKQHLDGEHALILARSRAYVDGDYTRQVNQRKVIMAIINKGLTAPAAELSGLIQASTKFLKTDKGIDFDFIYDLANQIRHNNDYEIKIYTATIPSSTAEIDGVSWVIADTAGTKAMMKLFEAGKDVSEGVTETSIEEDVAAAKGPGAQTGAADGTQVDEGAVGVSYYEEPQQESYENTEVTYDDTGSYDETGYYEESAPVETQSYEGEEGEGEYVAGDDGSAVSDGAGDGEDAGAEGEE